MAVDTGVCDRAGGATWYYSVVFAFAGPRWRIRPYAELYLVNILRRPGQAGGHLFLGLSAVAR